MKRFTSIIMVAVGTLLLVSCRDCSIVEDNKNPMRQFRLVDAQGNDLWFGDSAMYDPNAVVFEHETDGVIPVQVNTGSQSVGVLIPMTNGDEEKILVRLDSASVDVLRYAAFIYEKKCTREYELSYILQNDTKICSLCGSNEFENDGYIYLKE